MRAPQDFCGRRAANFQETIMQKHHAVSLIAALLLGTALTSAHAASATLTVAQARAVVDKEIELVTKNYVFEDKRAAIAAGLRANEAAGKYDIANPAALADTLGSDAIALSHDKHMWVKYDPDQYAAMMEQDKQGAPSEKQIAFFIAQETRTNQGYEELKVLPGNIRYVNLVNFLWMGDTPQAVTDAARFMGDGDAVIIDLRENHGGTPDAVRAIVSYFLPPDHRLLMSYHDSVTGESETSRVTDKLAAPRMVGKPLYVLTSGSTGSAAEEFAYHIKNFKLGTLIGEPTAGAANNDSITPVAPGFVISTSTGRPVHPVTGTNWEGTGVLPDVAVPADRALDRAELLALKKLAATPGPHAAEYAWGISGVEAKLSPPAELSERAKAEYAGIYGERTIRVENGKLVYQRKDRAPMTMTLMANDLFTVGMGDQTRIRFHREGGKVTGLDLLTADGPPIGASRSP
jgi:hypothetical protein